MSWTRLQTRAFESGYSGCWNRLLVPNPLHSLAECVEQRVNSKVLFERGSPALSGRLGSWPLTEQSKYGS